MIKYFDLHCDTAPKAFYKGTSLSSNDLHVSLDRLGEVKKYSQIMAVFSRESGTDEECFAEFNEVLSYHEKEKNIHAITNASELDEHDNSYIWAVEDARILCGELSRIDHLYDCGVRVITPVWGGETIIGGAFNTSKGLTDFGRSAVSYFLGKGIIPDISHSSVETADEIFELADIKSMPVIASHSCAYSVYGHPRNLRDCQFEKIKSSGGIVGLSFCAHHLTDSDNTPCTIEDIMKHIEHYLSLDGEDILCIGADFDGAGMPNGIDGIQSMPALYRRIEQRHGEKLADKIFYENAYSFFKKHLK